MSIVRTLVAKLWLTLLFILLTQGPVQAQSITNLHLALGNPSNATSGISNESNYLIERPQYAISYHRSKGAPNWVSWHLSYLDLGGAPRSDFRPDSELPAGWYRVTPSDYTGSGYDRGHMCPSGDRTASPTDNQATFLMTNIMPQTPDNNQGPWAGLEEYCRGLVRAGNELYVASGGEGYAGAMVIAGGRVAVPAYTWKVIVVLAEGANDLSRVGTGTRVIAVRMPNRQGIRYHDWRLYRVSVDQIERGTGYNFLSNVAANVQSIIEARVDVQP